MINSVPDLLSGLGLQRGAAQMRLRMEDVGVELATGRQSDLHEASGGDMARLYAIEGKLARLTARADTLALAEGRAEASQQALGILAGTAKRLGVDTLGAIGLGDFAAARLHAATGRDAFGEAVAALNARFAGRSLFGGAATDTAPLIDAEAILAEVSAAVDLAADVPGALAAIDTYFNDPAGGFATSAFQGSALDAPAAELAEASRLAYARRADEDAVRGYLQGLATLVIGAEHPIAATGLPAEEALFTAGAELLLAAEDGLAGLRAALGTDQARIETALVRNGAERTATEIARSRMIARDPYEAASEFQALEAQMQSVYAVTARLSGLSLTNFLR